MHTAMMPTSTPRFLQMCHGRRAGLAVVVACGLGALAAVRAADPASKDSATAAVGPFTVEKSGAHCVVVNLHGKLVAEYVVDRANKPFLWPIIGPTGKSMTRTFPMAASVGEAQDHVHQRGLTFGHQEINGFNTWAEEASFHEGDRGAAKRATLGRIRHREYRKLEGGETAVIHAVSDVLDPHNKPLLVEERRMAFSVAPDARVIDLDSDFIAAYGPVEIGDIKDAGLLIRVPDSMAVDRKQGGVIVNAAGLRNADAWGKRATWVDYHGPVEGDHVGIAILNHPSSFRHPTPWHVRGYGLFCANPFGLHELDPTAASGTFMLKQGERFSLRHRFIFHVGDEQKGKIAEAYAAYAAAPRPALGEASAAPAAVPAP
jgi:hypothetical protein